MTPAWAWRSLAAPAQFGPVGATPTLLRLAAFAAAAAAAAGVVAAAYRWYSRRRVPAGPAVLTGVAVVAVYLNAVGLYGDVLTGEAATVFSPAVVAFNAASLAVAAGSAAAGRLLGDRVVTEAFAMVGVRELDERVGGVARSVGRVTAVELPAEIDGMEGYAPVAPSVTAELAGKTLFLPRRLTVAELHDRLVTRLKQDYGVGHVDLELDADGAVGYLALGSRAAGVGPTLAPGSVACTVRADPAAGASPGDVVQLWRPGTPPERVVTAELRATGEDAVTVALDEADAAALDASTTYRAVTLPATPRVEREFAAALRSADETMGVLAAAPGSDLVGRTVGSVEGSVVAVRPPGGPVEALPSRSRTVAAEDVLYVVARPGALRRLEARATPPAPGSGPGSGPDADDDSDRDTQRL